MWVCRARPVPSSAYGKAFVFRCLCQGVTLRNGGFLSAQPNNRVHAISHGLRCLAVQFGPTKMQHRARARGLLTRTERTRSACAVVSPEILAFLIHQPVASQPRHHQKHLPQVSSGVVVKWTVPAQRAPPLSSQGHLLYAPLAARLALALSPLILLMGPEPKPQEGRQARHMAHAPAAATEVPAVGLGLCCPKVSFLHPALGPAPSSLQHLLKDLADAGSGMWGRPVEATQHNPQLVGISQSWVLWLPRGGGEGVK